MVRKPAGESWESFVDRQIREAQERGEFDDLPGSGKPIPDLHRPHDELWWVRKKLKEEGLAYVPPSLQIRKDVDEALARVEAALSERQVREIVTEVNDAIRRANRSGVRGPATMLVPLDEERVVREWRERREAEDS